MSVQFYKETSEKKEDWIYLFKSLNVGIQDIKVIRFFGEKMSITKPTGFILNKKNNFVAVGYTHKSTMFFDTSVFNPETIAYKDNHVGCITLHNFHHCLYQRLKLLNTLDLVNLTEIKYFELSRKCLFAVFCHCDIDTNILYQRELTLLKHIEKCDPNYFKKLKMNRDIYKVLYDLYQTKVSVNDDFLMVYNLDVLNMTYKWTER